MNDWLWLWIAGAVIMVQVIWAVEKDWYRQFREMFPPRKAFAALVVFNIGFAFFLALARRIADFLPEWVVIGVIVAWFCVWIIRRPEPEPRKEPLTQSKPV